MRETGPENRHNSAKSRMATLAGRSRRMTVSRRSIIRAGTAALAAPGLSALRFATPAAAQGANWKHGLSLFGEPQYPANFPHFSYVNPAAPKGGIARQIAFGTFDNFNLVVAGVK